VNRNPAAYPAEPGSKFHPKTDYLKRSLVDFLILCGLIWLMIGTGVVNTVRKFKFL